MSRARRAGRDRNRSESLEAFEALPVAVVLAEAPDYRLCYTNRAFRELVGDVSVGCPLAEALPELGAQLAAAMSAVAGNGRTARVALEPIDRVWQGETSPRPRQFDVLCARLDPAGGGSERVCAVLVEATERVAANAQLAAHANRQGVLAAATAALHRSLEPSDELRALAWAAVPELADLAMVHRLVHPVPPGRQPPLPVLTNQEVVASPGPRLDLSTPRRGLRWGEHDVLPQAIRLGRLVHGSMASQPPEWLAQAGTAALIRAGLHTVAAAPVVVENEVVAAVVFGCFAERPPWQAEDLAVLGKIAEKAGHALGHGLSYQHTRESALTLQRSLLTAPPKFPGLEICVRYEPAGTDEIGGDWYDAFPLDQDGLAIVVGDVVGHDMTAAAAMGQLRATLRGLALDRAESPAAVLGRLDAITLRLAITPFASMIYGQLRGTAGGWRLRWANAGHPPPLLVSGDHACSWLDQAKGLVLGTGETRTHRTDAEIDLGDRILLLYTDGLVEHPTRTIDSGMAELARLAGAFDHSQPLDQLCHTLIRHTPAADDRAILAVRAGRPKPPC